MKRVGVLVHPTRPVQEALEILRRWTEERGLELVQVPAGEQPAVAPAGEVIVVATPMGSSAYSMAAGGPLLDVGTNAFVCTPLAMHGGCAPPVVVSDDQQVSLEAHPGFGGFDLQIDGSHVASATQRFVV